MRVSRNTTPSNWFEISVDDVVLGDVCIRAATGMEFVNAVDLESRKYQKACAVSEDDPLIYDEAGSPMLTQVQNAKMVYKVYATYNWVDFRSKDAGTPFIELDTYNKNGDVVGSRPMKNTVEDKQFVLENSPEFFGAFSNLLSALNKVDEADKAETEELAKN